MALNYIFSGKRVSYTDEGSGNVVVLLHGYLETKEVWQSFSEKLAKEFRVICLDLPGHGKSELIEETHSMLLLAKVVNSLLMHLNIDKCTMVGHSMGGYVLLAFAEKFASRLNKLILFHSTVYADTEEKRDKRLREIDFIEKGKLESILKAHLPNTFATHNLNIFEREINSMKKWGTLHNAKGVCAMLRGMIERPDQQEFIKNCTKPMLFIFGCHDNFISKEVAEQMVSLNTDIKLRWLFNSGHMGFIEEESKSLKILIDFIN